MNDPFAYAALLDGGPGAHPSSGSSAFPQDAGVLLDRLGSLYGLAGELEQARKVVELLSAVPMETSVSLRPSFQTELRLTLGIPPSPDDPDSRRAVVAALSGLGAGRVCTTVDEALASVAPAPGGRRSVRALALRARGGERPRLRVGGWVGGETVAKRSTRVTDALSRVGLDEAAALHRRLTAQLAANPFNTVVAYGLGFEVGPDRVLAAKTYFACEWADATAALLRGRLADDLHLEADGLERLIAFARAGRPLARWPMELSFEFPADPALGARVKAYLLPSTLASNEADGHTAVLRLVARFGLDPKPYLELITAVRADGLSSARSCSLSVGVSAGARGESLEVYVLNPGR